LAFTGKFWVRFVIFIFASSHLQPSFSTPEQVGFGRIRSGIFFPFNAGIPKCETQDPKSEIAITLPRAPDSPPPRGLHYSAFIIHNCSDSITIPPNPGFHRETNRRLISNALRYFAIFFASRFNHLTI
jgi:hypothetical protein